MPGARNTQKTVPVKKMTSGQKTDLSIGIAAGVGAGGGGG